jgi:hypothetical protein
MKTLILLVAFVFEIVCLAQTSVYTPVTRVFSDDKGGYAAVIHGQIYLLTSGVLFGKSGQGATVQSVVRDVATNGVSEVHLFLREVPVHWTVEKFGGGKRYEYVAIFHLTPGMKVEHVKDILYPWQGSNEVGRRGSLGQTLGALGLPDARNPR